MAQELRVQLKITGFDYDPRQLTEIVGLAPSKTWVVDEFIERTKRTYKSNGWRISVPGNIVEIEAGVDALLAVLAPRWEVLRDLSQTCSFELSVVVYASGQMPALHLRKDQVRKFAELASDIDIDVYCYGGD